MAERHRLRCKSSRSRQLLTFSKPLLDGIRMFVALPFSMAAFELTSTQAQELPMARRSQELESQAWEHTGPT